ncbi:hypothetical protein FUAX_08510 [Fulvitalea axinellae]|uniref:3-keto-alpha-glucoside-1,2-lyase/3-keto-2-hydroxy-glucal hydratase domain-containing protein n=1 Tax=Fulvitalea axinellae TaxID=1182444 RepID=A0AAU9D1W2_9BACT|nr:hypothetical protein FUAX_08510 [Fulvitalea axinellae]
MRKIFSTLTMLALLVAVLPLQAQTDGWTNLFNGKNLKGWTSKGGKAKYEVIDGQIVGTSTMNTPNTFLCTKKKYGDFIIEYETKVEPLLNSGIMFRAQTRPNKDKTERVYGYQCEVETSPRSWTGGIYDEARRGWIYNLARNPKAGAAYKHGDWNTIRIEAIGNTIRTWVNGVQASYLVDDFDAEGIFGLQVHGIGRDQAKNGKKVYWRNIRIKTSDFEADSYRQDPHVPVFNYIPNTLTASEKHDGWKLLWNGKDTEGWRGSKSATFPSKGWQISNGELIVEKADGAESGNGGDIITKDKYSQFELEVDFMMTKGANSGIKYFVDPEINKGKGSSIGLEFQILDDKNHPDAKKGTAGNRTVASLYDLITAKNLIYPYRKKGFNGIGKWNRARIVVSGDRVEHWLNNNKVVEYERGSQMFRALVAYSKYSKWENFGELPEGHILLQDHGDEVHFRSIKIKPLRKPL